MHHACAMLHLQMASRAAPLLAWRPSQSMTSDRAACAPACHALQAPVPLPILATALSVNSFILHGLLDYTAQEPSANISLWLQPSPSGQGQSMTECGDTAPLMPPPPPPSPPTAPPGVMAPPPGPPTVPATPAPPLLPPPPAFGSTTNSTAEAEDMAVSSLGIVSGYKEDITSAYLTGGCVV